MVARLRVRQSCLGQPVPDAAYHRRLQPGVHGGHRREVNIG